MEQMTGNKRKKQSCWEVDKIHPVSVKLSFSALASRRSFYVIVYIIFSTDIDCQARRGCYVAFTITNYDLRFVLKLFAVFTVAAVI